MTTSARRILHDAANLLGRVELAKGLGVTDSELADWIAGLTQIPSTKFLLLSNVLIRFAAQKP